jgi:cytidine deaminase
VHPEQLTREDRQLLEDAKEVIRKRYRPGTGRKSQSVGTALRTDAGNTYTGVSLTADTPRASVCAEPIAVGRAITAGDADFDTIVAVKHAPGEDPRAGDDSDTDGEAMVISACGVCRELIRDYDPTTQVVVSSDDGPVKVPVTGLLPGLEWRGDTGE